MRKLFVVALEIIFYMVTVSEALGLCTCKLCYHCTGCSATSCKGRNRALRLLDYLDIYDQEVQRQLQVISPSIPCSIPNKMCDPPYNKYCCDGTTMTCGLGEGWSTCVAGSALINNIITPIYTKSQCDFDFPCTGNSGNDCCGGLDLYNGEGAGTCSTTYCTSSDLQLVACNYVGTSTAEYKTPVFDATVMVNGAMPTQSNNDYCGNGNRNSGRCRASNLCCSPLGLCSKVDSCTTKSISWAWYGGSVNAWVQTGGAADSSIPCGNGIIGHGQCPTDASTYGIQCCSDTGFCNSSYCNGASGNTYTCSCSHGSPARGTRGCNTCASCNDGYYMSSSNANTCSPVQLGNFNCPSSSSFIKSIELWYDSGSKFITGIDSLTCSDGSIVNVSKGQHTGAHRSSTETSGYCGGKVGYVYRPLDTKNQFTTELTVFSCDGVISTSYGGPIPNEPTNFSIAYGFQGGKQLTGIQAATCENGGSNNVCFLNFIFTTVQTPSPTPSIVVPTPVPSQKTAAPTPIPSSSTTTVSCSSGRFITKINLSAGSYVNGITSIACSDNAIMQISSGLTGTPYTATSGDGTSSSLGYCSFKSGLSSSFVTQLKFVECTGVVDGTYGTTSATLTTVKCPTGQKAVGLTLTQGGGFLTSFAFVCGTIARNVSCGSGMYITQIILWSSDVVYGISSITCSDGSSKQVNTGLISGTPSTASSTGGYCAYSTGLSGSFIAQFTLGECTTSANDGPYGTNSATVSMHGCSSGQMASGVKTSTGTALTSFSFACATVATAAPTTVKPTAAPSAAPTPVPTQTVKPTATPTAAPTPVPTQTPVTVNPTAAPSAPTPVPVQSPTTISPTSAPTVICYCPNGVAGVGSAYCHTCISCKSGYDLDLNINFCVLTTVVKCGAGEFITQLQMMYDGKGTKHVDGISSMTCSDGSSISVLAGATSGTPFTATAGDGSSSSPGYCASSEIYYIAGASQLKLTECAGGIVDGPYGSFHPVTPISVTKTCGIGELAIGVEITSWGGYGNLLSFSLLCGPITVAPSAAPTTVTPSATQTAAPTPVPIETGTYLCPTGQLVNLVSLELGDGLNWFDAFTCTDGSTVYVGIGTEAGGNYYAAYGPFSSYTSGYYTGNTAATSGLYFSSYDSTQSVIFGDSYGSQTTKSCPTGMYLSGFSVTPIASNSLVSLGSTAICSAGGTCSCVNGVGGVGSLAGCTTCRSCNSGYALNALDATRCDATTVVTCPAATFITQLQLLYYFTGTKIVDGIKSMTCSDGSTVSGIVLGLDSSDPPFTATAGDGTSTSPGYCASSMVYTFAFASQLKLTECTGGFDGPFGSYQPATSISVTKTCGIGERAIGVAVTKNGLALLYFSIVCGPIP